MAEVKRLNYFTSQFLVEDDFKLEQTYHRDMRWLHNRSLHSWGIAEGLQVTKTGDRQVSVAPGTALDKEGREIVLPSDPAPSPLDLTQFGANANVYATIAWREVQDEVDRYTAGSVDNYTRTTERARIEVGTATPPADGSVTPLALVHLDGTGNVASIDESVRKFAGSDIPPGRIHTAELADQAITEGKLADNAVSRRTLVNGAVDASKLADKAVSIRKLNADLIIHTSTTIVPLGTTIMTVLDIPATDERGACFLIKAYSPTEGAIFSWEQRSRTQGGRINHTVVFENKSAVAIQVVCKIYELFE